MDEKENDWNKYCLTVQGRGLKPIPYQLFTDTVAKLDPNAQCEYTDWFWNQRGKYHQNETNQ